MKNDCYIAIEVEIPRWLILMEENGKLLSLYYEGKDLRALEEDFHDAIDFYLENCADEGREPERAKGIIRMHYLE